MHSSERVSAEVLSDVGAWVNADFLDSEGEQHDAGEDFRCDDEEEELVQPSVVVGAESVRSERGVVAVGAVPKYVEERRRENGEPELGELNYVVA